MMPDSITIERRINAPIPAVWQALLNCYTIRQWDSVEVGAEFQSEMAKSGKCYRQHCKIMDVMPERRLCYVMRLEDYRGLGYVTLEWRDEGETTRFKVTQTGLESFADNEEAFETEDFAIEWSQFFDFLDHYMCSAQPGPPEQLMHYNQLHY
jgi:uncharacterized protein YndB with AHSA1/START domain